MGRWAHHGAGMGSVEMDLKVSLLGNSMLANERHHDEHTLSTEQLRTCPVMKLWAGLVDNLA